MCVPVLRVHRQNNILTDIGGTAPGWSLGFGSSPDAPWGLTVDEAAAMIESRAWDFFVEVPAGVRVPVLAKKSPTGKRFLTTSRDGIEANNLEALPDLGVPLAGVVPPFPLNLAGPSLVSQLSVKDAHYRYKPAPTSAIPNPPWSDIHGGPFTNVLDRSFIAVPQNFWTSGGHTLQLDALLPYPAVYAVRQWAGQINGVALEEVGWDSIDRRHTLEAQGKGWWTWDLVLTRPDGSIDPSKPSRLTEVKILIKPDANVSAPGPFRLVLEARGINQYCATVRGVVLDVHTPVQVPDPGRPAKPEHVLPDVVGLPLDQAYIALDPCHLSTYTVGATSVVAKDFKVVSQSVPAGTRVKEGSVLSLRVEALPSGTITGFKELVVTNESNRFKPLELWLFDYTIGGWNKKATLAHHATITVPLLDKHLQQLAAVDPTDTGCRTGRPDEVNCVAWSEVGPRLGASSGTSLPVTIT